ncbi:MAG: cell division protein ZipA C-terminal FtsZ-binding domain-containing protein [Gammaproteobacteria bacterium]
MELRIILILAGALLILGLYLWEKYRRAPGKQTPPVEEQQPGQLPATLVLPSTAEAGDRERSSAKPHTPPAGAPQQVFVLHVISRENLRGPDIIAALNAADMQPGPMRIFHRYHAAPEPGSDSRPVFSLANMVEPGHIPAEDAGNFTTPGLVLFMPLPNVQDGMTVFEDMFAAARQLAETLNAEVCDEQRNILTLQALEHTRERIREWQRLQLLTQAQRPS